MSSLIPSCKKALQEQICLGCQALENPGFNGEPNCEFNKVPTVNECIEQIHMNLGMKYN